MCDFSDLQTTQIEPARIAKPSILHFLMAMYWLKIYSSVPVMAATFKVDEKTAQSQVWKYVLAIPAHAKELLRKDILNGKVVDSMTPKEVLAMRPENEPDRKNAGTNLRNLQKTIMENQAKADSDSSALAHDRRIFPPSANTSQGYPRWDGSDAQRLMLMQD
jgi:hypothetical protein